MFWSIIFFSLIQFSRPDDHSTYRDTIMCGDITCFNQAMCLEDRFVCQCRAGFKGETCQDDFDECSFGQPCYHRGYCNNTYGSWTCQCLEGWKNGPRRHHCEIKTTLHNRLCMTGWMGDLCQDQCLNSTMCAENQVCKKYGRGQRCLCDDGWEGENCTTDIDECKISPCKNHEVCTNTDGSFTCSCPIGWQGNNCSDDINECMINPCNDSGTCINTAGSFYCNCTDDSNGTSCDEVQRFHFEDAVRANCTSYGWNISLDVTILQSLYTGITPKDIYLGLAKCKGTPHDNELWFQQSFNSCLTSEKEVDGTKVFQNVLFYATLDSVDPTIIRQHFWTYNVACYVANGETASSHLHHEVESHSTNITGHRDIALTFFKDQNFLHRVSGNPLRVTVGDKIYVKVSTAIPDWNTKMRLHTCYTRSSDNALAEHTLIKDGCEVDSSTHIISQSTHETKFVFRDFEYETFNEGLDIYCNATFCATGDYSPACTQACRQSPPIVG